MSFLDRFRRKREDPEAARRARLLRSGRIADGTVFDVTDDSGTGAITQIFYRYNISGVDYESSQQLDQEQSGRQSEYAPGAHVTVRYDPHQPGNSVVA